METQSFIDALGGHWDSMWRRMAGLMLSYSTEFLCSHHLRSADSSFLLHMEIGYPTAMGGGNFAKLLGANLLLSETMGAALSLDERTGMAGFLEYLVPLPGLDGAGFVARVEGFGGPGRRVDQSLAGMGQENRNPSARTFG